MVAKSAAAKANRRTSDAKRKREKYATDEDHREEKKAQSARTNVKQEWFVGVAHAIVTDDDGERTHHARFTREGFQHFVFTLFHCARECRLNKAARKKAEREAKKKKPATEGDDDELDEVAADEEEAPSDDDASETTETTETTETDDTTETTETIETTEIGELYTAKGEYIRTHEECLVETLEMDPFDYKVNLDYWNVTCLERPLDLNTLIKLQQKVSQADVMLVLDAVCARWGRSERFGDLEPAYVQVSPPTEQSMWGMQAYFMFGRCYNNHKTAADVDPTPLVGFGDIDVKSSYHKEFLLYCIEKRNVRSWDELEAFPWFQKSTVKKTIDECDWNKRAAGRVKKAAKYVTSAEKREAKLRRYAECEVINMDRVINILKVLKWHKIDPDAYRQFILRHFTEERLDNVLRQPHIVGPSGGGKGVLCDGLKALLGTGIAAQEKASAYAWRHINMMNATNELDTIIFEELGATLRAKIITECALFPMLLNTAEFMNSYCNELPGHMPIMLNNQSYFLKTDDYSSLRRRLDNLYLTRRKLPKCWDEKLPTGGPAFSYWLYNPACDAMMDDIVLPEWDWTNVPKRDGGGPDPGLSDDEDADELMIDEHNDHYGSNTGPVYGNWDDL